MEFLTGLAFIAGSIATAFAFWFAWRLVVALEDVASSLKELARRTPPRDGPAT